MSGVGTPACVGVDGNAHPLVMGDAAAAGANGTVVGSSTMGLKEERMDVLLGVGGRAGIHMGGGMNGVGNMGLEMMGMVCRPRLRFFFWEAGEKRKRHVGWMNIQMDYNTTKRGRGRGRKGTNHFWHFFFSFV